MALAVWWELALLAVLLVALGSVSVAASRAQDLELRDNGTLGPISNKLLDISLPPALFGGQTKAVSQEWRPEDDLKTKEGREILAHAYYCRLEVCSYGVLCTDAKSKVSHRTYPH